MPDNRPVTKLLKQSVTSSAYNVTANIFQVVLLFGRSIILARLLNPQTFGTYALASSIVHLTRPLAIFGLGGALLYRTPEGQEETARRVHFTLTASLGIVWTVLLAAGAELFAPPDTRVALWVVTGAAFATLMTRTPRTLLTKRVWFRRLAFLQAITAVATTAVAVGMAWYGLGLWSLLTTDIVSAALALLIFYGIRPVWRPRLGWASAIARDFLRFGSQVFMGGLLSQALDRVDDIWTGIALGDTPLGFYSRAYRFANYPRILLAKPLNQVVAGTYAQVKDHRKRLSKTFFRVNAAIVRVDFLLAGLLTLIAPEFIRIGLGSRWLPMLDAFRLMLLYTLLDPIKVTTANVITAAGAPERVVRARAIQLGVFLLGLVTMGPLWGIAGVALAVDLMLMLGMGILFWEARRFVDFDLRRLFAAPTLALVVGMGAARTAILIPGVLGSPWRTGGVKFLVFSPLYVGLLLLLEKDQINLLLNAFRQLLPRSG